jgi:membrane protein implicated in regulation of membrane protease activity
MIPFAVGVALLLADSLRKVGWLLVWGASAAMGAAVLQSLLFSFRTTSLWSLMTMVVMIAAGGGLMFRSLRDYQELDQQQRQMEQDDSRQKINALKEELEQLKSRLDRH